MKHTGLVDQLKSLISGKKNIASLIIFLLLLVSIPIGTYLVKQQQIFKPKAYEKKADVFKSDADKKPEYVQGEVLVKFRSQVKFIVKQDKKSQGIDIDKNAAPLADLEQENLPAAVQSIHQKYKLKTIEKVFKGADSPQEELDEFKKSFAPELNKGERKINEKELLKIDLSRTYKLEFEIKDVPIEQIIQDLSRNPEIEYAEPNFIYKKDSDPNDPYFQDYYPDKISNRDSSWNPPHDYQWNIKKTNSSNNWLIDTSSIITAVIDSGVDVTHPELGNVWVNTAEVSGDGIDNDQNGCIDDVNGCAFIVEPRSGTGYINDTDNHGTHVAGVISVKTNNSVGIAGVTSNTKIMAVKVFRDGDRYTTASKIAEGVKYAVDNGARVMNMSIGGSYSQVFKEALDYATSHNVISVAAAGNGSSYSPSHFPASYKPAITVGGVDEELNKMKYANYGPNIDVAAPGGGKPCEYHSKPSYCSNIISLKSSQNSSDQDHVVNEKYLRMSGTSMATPHVAGVIALLLAKNPQFTLQDVEDYIRLNSIDPEGKGHNEKTGWGVINSAGTNFVPPSNIDFVINYPAENSLIGKKFNVAGLIKADNFDHYEVSYRKQGTSSWLTTGVELVNNGRAQGIPFGSNSNAKVASINLPDSSPLGVYEIKTALFMTNGKFLNSTKTVNFFQKQGTQWLFPSDDKTYPQEGNILLSDINNDSNQEIILYDFGDWNKKTLSVFDNKYNLLWKVDSLGEAVVGDLDKRSPGKEVALETSIYSASGTLIDDMTLNIGFNSRKNLMAVDTDNNGVDELYIHDGNTLHAFEQNSAYQFVDKWNYQANDSSIYHNWPLAGDINGDGKKEILVVNNGNKFEALNNQGLPIAQFALGGNYPVDRMILADMDLDKKEEIIFHIKWGETKMLKLKDNTFDVVWSHNNSNNAESLSAGDFDNDGYPEVIIQVNNTGNEVIIDRNGSLISNGIAPLYWSWSYGSGVVLADKDNNNKTEIFHNANEGADRRYYYGLREFDNFSKQMNFVDGDWKAIFSQWNDLTSQYESPYNNTHNIPIAVGDLDNNNKLDLVIGGIGIIEYESKGKIYWPFLYHDAGRTSSYNTVISSPTPTPSPSSTPSMTPSPTPRATPTPIPTPSPSPTPSSSPAVTPTPAPSSQAQFCGGIAGISCPAGFTCKLDGNYPDAGGVCIPEAYSDIPGTYTRYYRIYDSPFPSNPDESNIPWKQYSQDNIQETITFNNPAPGQELFVFVQFKDSRGEVKTYSQAIEYMGE